MKRKFDTKAIVITGLLLALEIVLQTIGNYLQIGPANINLSLVPVVLAAVLCGPISGGILGFFNGLMALLSPSTLAVFMPLHPFGTVLVCLLKCTLAGIGSAYIFRLCKRISFDDDSQFSPSTSDGQQLCSSSSLLSPLQDFLNHHCTVLYVRSS